MRFIGDIDCLAPRGAATVPAFAIAWRIENLAWRKPALLAEQRRCVGVIARYASA